MSIGYRYSIAVLAALLCISRAQQLSGAQAGVEYPGLSAGCKQALNTSVSCPLGLGPLSSRPRNLDDEEVKALCVDSCRTSLDSAKGKIKSACGAKEDVIVNNRIAYPAIFVVDNFLFTYDVSCRKDKKTSEFCSPQFLAWSNSTNSSSENECSDCWLGVVSLQLSNPLGYDQNLASRFSSLTSSCSSPGYAFSSPTPYALNSTAASPSAPSTPTPPPGCTGSYTVKDTDNCNTVAKALGVSTYNLLYQNNLDIYCQNFQTKVGKSLCTPPTCKTYTWQIYDSCESVVSNFTGMTIPQFKSWNPNFNSLCQNTLNFIGYEVCVSPPGGSIEYKSPSNSTSTGFTSPIPAPTNAPKEANKDCGNWHTVISGDDCGKLSLGNFISLSDFYFLNPTINKECTNLELGVAYCVAPVNDITTYPGYPKPSGPVTPVGGGSFPPVNTAIPPSGPGPGYNATLPLLPQAAGTVQGCNTYRNFDGKNGLNDCSYVSYAYDVTVDQLRAWNPSLSSNLNDCDFQSGFSYCVMQSKEIPTVDPPSYCITINATEPGTAPDCSCFTQIRGSQKRHGYNCDKLTGDFSITTAQLGTWNPWLANNCNDALFANLQLNQKRAVCIGVNASAPIGGASDPPSPVPMPAPSGTNPDGPAGPTQSGMVAGCKQFYTVKKDDSCYYIQTIYDISFDQFFKWNPSVGKDCSNLWLGYSYCVADPVTAPGGSSKLPVQPTPVKPGPSAPTQAGIAPNCAQYYTVASGDGCEKIEKQFGITFDQLKQWNPAVGDQCLNLWVNYAVCVAVEG